MDRDDQDGIVLTEEQKRRRRARSIAIALALGALVLAALGEVPSPGDSTKVPGFVIAVTEMDGRRIARLRVTPAPPAIPGGSAPKP